MTAEEALAEAARLVEQGWNQGAYARDLSETQVCLVGAIRKALTGTVRITSALSNCDMTYTTALKAIADELHPALTIEWNDTLGRTKEEVATALRNAKRFLPQETSQA